MNPAVASHLAVRVLAGFVLALGALVLGVVLIRRMRLMLDEEFAAESPRPRQAVGRSEHRPVLPRQETVK